MNIGRYLRGEDSHIGTARTTPAPAVDPAQPFTEPGERRWSRVMKVMQHPLERVVRAFDIGTADDYNEACIAFDDVLSAELDRVTGLGVEGSKP